MIILIVGLPASGKSYLIKNNFSHFDLIVDDPKDINEVIGKKFTNMIIADPYLCDDDILNRAIDILHKEYPYETFQIRYFENNPSQCKINASHRQNKSVNDFIDLLSKIYNPPVIDYKVYK